MAAPTATRRRFEDAVVIVTGSSKRIGLATVCRLASEGARVVINARGEADLDGAASYVTGSTLVVDGGRLLVGGETVDLFGKCDPGELSDHFDDLRRAAQS